jgi:plastocyanin
MKQPERRRLLQLGGLAAAGGLAGCSSSAPEATSTAEPTPEDTSTDATTSTATPSETEASGDGNPPGADQLGGPEDLQTDPTVDALVLDSDQGAGQFVFSPAIVWVTQGSTVTWNIEGAGHSVTAYHEDNGKPMRVPEDASAFDSGTLAAGETYEHTFETPGVHNYYCKPHEGLGMVGLVIVEGAQGGPGTSKPSDLSSGQAAANLERLLKTAGVMGAGGDEGDVSYGYTDATWDSYWYSLFNMSTNIAMNGNGVQFPHNESQRKAFNERVPAMVKNADTDKPPVKNPNLNMAAFTNGDPHFTQKPVFDAGDGRPDADTLTWDKSKSSKIVSPASFAWTHLKGVTWAKNFQKHFEILPPGLAAKFRSMMLTTVAQVGIKGALIAGGPENNGLLTKGDSMELVSGAKPAKGEITDPTARPTQHAAMLWFLSDLTSLAQNGWFGYVNPEPLIPKGKIQQLTDGMGKTTMNLFSPSDISSMGTTRDLGLMLGAIGWYGTHAGSDSLRSKAATYADDLTEAAMAKLEDSGRVADGAENQAATQGMLAQGLLWASQIDGVDHTDFAASVTDYMTELYDEDAGTFASGEGDSTYRITSRDAADITGGINAAEAVLGRDLKDTYATFFDQTFNRGHLQRAQRPQSVDDKAAEKLPLPPNAGGEYGQAAVYHDAVEYDTNADEWRVVDDGFTTADALLLSNQDIWIGQWAGDSFQGRGVPGKSDTPP